MSERPESSQGSELRLYLIILSVAWIGCSGLFGLMEAFGILEASRATLSIAFLNGLKLTVIIGIAGAIPLLLLFVQVRKRGITRS
ncbi:MAG: hypothetical protein JNL40_11265 [Cyclobacteriaceae bacterium]|nr:hypothetical protein [Cyclobacteriaceae bacterium]